ncbi:MAG: hypothetical protein Q9224_001694 [Gallowayella concinna]
MADPRSSLSEYCIQCSGMMVCQTLTLERKHRIKSEYYGLSSAAFFDDFTWMLSSANLETPKPMPKEPFSFMKLPLELRHMVYREALVMPWPLLVSPHPWNWQMCPHRCSIKPVEGGRRRDYCPSATCQILQVSKTLYAEAMPVFYGENTFKLGNLESLCFFLTKLKPVNRRSIKSLMVTYDTYCPAKSMKLLQGCVSLRRLSLEFTWGALYYGGLPWSRIHGVRDLLKIRGIRSLTVHPPTDVTFLPLSLGPDWHRFLEALEVIKQPQSKLTLSRQYKKDYPPEKAKRTVFGKTNVVTRSEKRLTNTGENAAPVMEEALVPVTA